MPNALPDHVHAARIQDDLVILDAAGDDYFCVIQAFDADDVAPRPDVLALLAESDLLACAADEAACLWPEPTEIPNWHDRPPAHTTPGIRELIHFIEAFAWSSLRFRKARLPELMRTSRKPKSSTTRIDIHQAVATFEALALWLPMRPLCLFRSLMLRRYLGRLGHAVDWIVGVQLYPFQAHCWLARDGMVLGDHVHRLGTYQPILVDRAEP